MRQLSCFVVMPFGQKPDGDGPLIDFDAVYERIIKPAVEGLKPKVSCRRCDEIGRSGWIPKAMMSQLLEADLAVVDITTLNANVFYELGVRHALRRGVTVIIRKRGTMVPFNIGQLRVIDYELTGAGQAEARKQIAEHCRNGLKDDVLDSLVFEAIPDVDRRKAAQTVLPPDEPLEFHLSDGRQVNIAQGSISEQHDIADIWVNSENTKMLMARHFECSISGIIRYLGARKDETGDVLQDTIEVALRRQMIGKNAVAPGTVLVTDSGDLWRTHRVKKIFHVASAHGEAGIGYQPIAGIEKCVNHVLDKVANLQDRELKAILFPLMGCGTARGSVEELAPKLLQTAISALKRRKIGFLQRVYFLTWTRTELEVCRRFLASRLEPVKRRKRGVPWPGPRRVAARGPRPPVASPPG